MIAVLPPAVINQIAAGEVIERPFSVVKELVENSLDAGARRIHVDLVDGGRALVRVHDDGCGLSEQDLALAFVGHATSKLSSPDDLLHIASLGFRGEALASIGSISRARISSRQADASSGFEVSCEGGEMADVRPCGCPVGTTVEVAELFYNTPARRRFLRTAQAEKARIQDMIARLSLVHPEVDFTLKSDGREALRLVGGEQLVDRIGRVFGKEVASSLLEVDRQLGPYRVTGWVADPDAARRDSTLELLYVNGRLAKDRSVGFAIRQAYRPYLMPRRFPVYFLQLSLPPEDVDVNVHPTKAEVRFQQGRRVCGLLHDAVAAALEGRASRGGSAGLSVDGERPAARTGFPDLPADLFGRSTGPVVAPAASAPTDEQARPSTPSEPVAPPNPFHELRDRRFLQVQDLYLVMEGKDGGLVVVDQHALHERVLYEQLEAQHRDRSVDVQRLLVPEVLELVAADKAYLLEAREALAEEGFLVEDFGGNSVAVQGIPAVLDRARPAALVESFLRGDGEGDARPSAHDAILERFHSAACRRSVMKGDPLSDEEIGALLEAASQLQHPHNCPHGRPTVLTFASGELERFFKRRV